jgi:cephalosporin-C deacetylase-like acetyl esterase
MKKVWSLLLAYSFLFVYVINAQHSFEHIKNHETKHSCVQCFHLSKSGLKNKYPEFKLQLPQLIDTQNFIVNYQGSHTQKNHIGNVSKRGPPSFTI